MVRTQQDNYKLKAAAYLRLSKDDEDKTESASITNQRNIVREFAKSNGILITQEYVDDGFSGTNYDRPAFQRMINDIEHGEINCVLTKDLSRLGRNSARTTDLLDEYFPEHNVRYISIVDGYDSLNLTSGMAMTTPLVMAMHEMYARDISCKIRSSFRSKMKQGDYVGSFAPYGYQKDIENGNRNHLIIDHQVAYIVQEIFRRAANGESPGEIARILNKRKVATPSIYRCQKWPHLNIDNYSKRKEWTSAMVCKMLRNQVYLGHTIQGKTSKTSFKSKVVKSVPESDWIVVENTHDAIIPKELFDEVRRRVTSRRQPPTKGFHNVFSGIAKCADCGRNMTTAPTRKKGATYNLCCGGYKSYGARECSNHFIDYDTLCSTITTELRKWISVSEEDRKSILLEAEREYRNQCPVEDISKRISEAQERTKEVSALIKKLYEDHATGKVPSLVYDNLITEYSNELSTLEETIFMLREKESRSLESGKYEFFFSLLEGISNVDVLTRSLISKLIDRIEIEQGRFVVDESGKRVKVQKIKIYYKFIGCEEKNTP